MDRLVGLISGARGIRSANDDDIADRLSSRYTVALLITFAVLISMNQYVRNPITCWAPVHFTGAHTKFVFWFLVFDWFPLGMNYEECIFGIFYQVCLS